MTKSFKDLVLLSRINNPQLDPPFYGTLVCFDPGETTGVAVFKNLELIHSDQVRTKDIYEHTIDIRNILNRFCYDMDGYVASCHIIIEDYKVYSWKSQDHSWAELHTPKLIGAITAISALLLLPAPLLQMAQQAKGFCTDDKLQKWDYYKTGQRHARDAIRHGCYALLFQNIR